MLMLLAPLQHIKNHCLLNEKEGECTQQHGDVKEHDMFGKSGILFSLEIE